MTRVPAPIRPFPAEPLVIMPDNFFYSRAEQLAALTVRLAVPTIFRYRRCVAAGGLASYASSDTESYVLMGIYTGKILKGEKPGDLPVQQATKVELIINLKTARTLELTVSPSLFAPADEVIEQPESASRSSLASLRLDGLVLRAEAVGGEDKLRRCMRHVALPHAAPLDAALTARRPVVM